MGMRELHTDLLAGGDPGDIIYTGHTIVTMPPTTTPFIVRSDEDSRCNQAPLPPSRPDQIVLTTRPIPAVA